MPVGMVRCLSLAAAQFRIPKGRQVLPTKKQGPRLEKHGWFFQWPKNSASGSTKNPPSGDLKPRTMVLRLFFTDWDLMGWKSPSFKPTIWDHIFGSLFPTLHRPCKSQETRVPSWFSHCWAPMISTELLDLVTKNRCSPKQKVSSWIFFKAKKSAFLYTFSKHASLRKISTWIYGANSLKPHFQGTIPDTRNSSFHPQPSQEVTVTWLPALQWYPRIKGS